MNTENKSLSVVHHEDIKGKIYTIRGVQVMLDRNLAELYKVKAIALRQQVKRNIKRFPSDFMFQLTDREVDVMVSQNVIPSRKYLGGFLPYVFTEQGVANIASHKFVSDIIRKANTSIVIIDNFIDDTVLSLLTKRKEHVTAAILTKNISKQLQLDTHLTQTGVFLNKRHNMTTPYEILSVPPLSWSCLTRPSSICFSLL